MGMLGQWISKPRGFTEHDQRLNDLTRAELGSIQDDISGGMLWLGIREKWGFAPTARAPGNSVLDQHICQHWYNLNDEGWWPLEPAEEIRTEALSVTIERMLLSSASELTRKKVSSYWLCPGIRHFQIAICESDREINVLILTPSEGKDPTAIPENREIEGHHRPEYDKYVKSLVTGSGDSAELVSLISLLVQAPGPAELKPKLLEYKSGTTIKISDAADSKKVIYRRVESAVGSANGVVVTLSPGKGVSQKIAEPKKDMISKVVKLPDRNPNIRDEPAFTKEQNLWVVTRDDRAPITNVSAPTPDERPYRVPGTAIRRNKDDHIP